MRIAFYAPLNAPLNAPIDGTPSGDRRVGALLIQALKLAGHQVELVSTFRSFDGAGDPVRQAALRDEALEAAETLLARWCGRPPGDRPQLWFTYHLYYKAPDWLGPRLSGALGIPYVIAEASHAPKRASGPWALGHEACAHAIRHASLLLCPSRVDIPGLAALVGSSSAIVHVPPFLDAALLRAAAGARAVHRSRLAEAHALDTESPWLLAVGMMRHGDKLASYRELAQALSLLADRPWSLLVAGDGPARDHVASALATGIPGRATLLGELDPMRLAGVYAACDLMVWPAVNEAYGMALLEAQAAGLPVVAGKVRGVPEVVQDGSTGLLAPGGDPAAFARCVHALLDSPERRRAMGQAAAAFVQHSRSVEAAARRLAQHLPPRPENRARLEPGSNSRTLARPRQMQPRAFLYVQHLLGIGHLKRAVTLAQALARGGFEVAVASGGLNVPNLGTDRLRFFQLPPASTADLSFRFLLDGAGNPVDEQWKHGRREALLAAYRDFAPQVLLIELFPFGRRQMRFELMPLLEAAASTRPRPLIVSSVRDIGGGGQRDPRRLQETLEIAQRYFDLVLVHGDPALIAFENSFPLAAGIADRIRHTGYVVARPQAADANTGAGEVLVSAGGGAVGRDLLATALRARPLSRLHDRVWRVILGISASASDAAMIVALAEDMGDGTVVVERIRNDFTALLANCAVSVSQAGYNTVMEILAARARAVVVPFAGGAETEQMLRASALAQRGYIHVVAESDLGPQTLAAAIDRAAFGPPPPAAALDLDGAAASARILHEHLAARAQ